MKPRPAQTLNWSELSFSQRKYINMAQMWPPPKPKLAQEEFDEAVKTNVEDFDMQVRRLVSY